MSFLALKLIDKTVGLRVGSLHEQRGLDYSKHYEIGLSDFALTHSHSSTGA